MKLLTEKELIWSAVVANNRMNRERKASGVDSYKKELKFRPEEYIKNLLKHRDQIKWLDLCCGKGNALLQCAIELATHSLQNRVALTGLDLVDGFQSTPSVISCLKWKVQSVVDWEADDQYDLVTCVHGLHYADDKLKVLQTACKALTEKGIFTANLDLQNIRIPGCEELRYIKDLLTQNEIEYNVRRKVITCKGPRDMDFGLMYEGADDETGPTYTGQEAVDSYYSLQTVKLIIGDR
jgi:SAM-dependent methyltransferase